MTTTDDRGYTGRKPPEGWEGTKRQWARRRVMRGGKGPLTYQLVVRYFQLRYFLASKLAGFDVLQGVQYEDG